MADNGNTSARIKQLVLAAMRQKPINDIKVKEIADALLISRSTFYLYFDSVYAVLQQLEDDFFKGFHARHVGFTDYPLSDEYFDTPHPLLTKGLEYLLENKELILTLFGAYGDLLFQRNVKQLVYEYFIEKATRSRYLTTNENSDYICAFLAGGHIDMMIEWLKYGSHISPEIFSIQVYRMMFGFYINKNT